MVKRRAVSLLLVGVLAGAAIGCDDPATDDSTPVGPWHGGATDLADVIYEGGATDEALVALVGREATSPGAAFVAPMANATLPAATPFTFQWSAAMASAEPTIAERVLGFLLGGVSEAYAHGTPISGRAYFLVFKSSSNAKLLRVFTTGLTYTPDAAAWQRLVDAGSFTVVIGDAIFDENKITEGGGPFVGAPISLKVQ